MKTQDRPWSAFAPPAGFALDVHEGVDLDDPFGPRDLYVLRPIDVGEGELGLVVFNDGDTTVWRGGPAHDTWDVAGTVARLRADAAPSSPGGLLARWPSGLVRAVEPPSPAPSSVGFADDGRGDG